MLFALPLLPAFVAATAKAITIAEAISIGTGAIGIGAGIKGAMDYCKANDVQKEAINSYQTLADKVKRKIKIANSKLSSFAKLKQETYFGILKRSAAILSRFKNVYLSAFYNDNPMYVDFGCKGIDEIEKAGIGASDIFSCLFAGISAATQENYPYKSIAPLLSVGAFGIKNNQFDLLKLPYGAFMAAGLNWGMSGGKKLTYAKALSKDLDIETQKMSKVLVSIKDFIKHICEGEHLIAVFSSRLEPLLAELENITMPENKLLPLEIINKVETTISLTKALKQILDVDIFSENRKSTREAGILFRSLSEEYSDVA